MPALAEYFRVLKYPLIVWLIGDTVVEILLILVPGYRVINNSFARPAVWSLPIGAWVGYKMIEFKGNLFHAMVAGAVIGIWCALLAVIYSGIGSVPYAVITTPAGLVVLAQNWAGALPYGFFFFMLNFIGAIVGAGFALTRRAS